MVDMVKETFDIGIYDIADFSIAYPKSNLFCLDSLYRSMPKKSFIKGRKQELEAILLYCWLHGVTSDDEYWNEYAQQVL